MLIRPRAATHRVGRPESELALLTEDSVCLQEGISGAGFTDIEILAGEGTVHVVIEAKRGYPRPHETSPFLPFELGGFHSWRSALVLCHRYGVTQKEGSVDLVCVRDRHAAAVFCIWRNDAEETIVFGYPSCIKGIAGLYVGGVIDTRCDSDVSANVVFNMHCRMGTADNKESDRKGEHEKDA